MAFSPRIRSLEPLFHSGRHQAGDIAAQPDHFFHQMRTDERMRFTGHQEHRLDLRPQPPVHQRHLQFVLVVGDGANSANNQRCAACWRRNPPASPSKKSTSTFGYGRDHFLAASPSALGRENRRLLPLISQHATRSTCRPIGCALNQIEMTVRDGIERTRDRWLLTIGRASWPLAYVLHRQDSLIVARASRAYVLRSVPRFTELHKLVSRLRNRLRALDGLRSRARNRNTRSGGRKTPCSTARRLSRSCTRVEYLLRVYSASGLRRITTLLRAVVHQAVFADV